MPLISSDSNAAYKFYTSNTVINELEDRTHRKTLWMTQTANDDVKDNLFMWSTEGIVLFSFFYWLWHCAKEGISYYLNSYKYNDDMSGDTDFEAMITSLITGYKDGNDFDVVLFENNDYSFDYYTDNGRDEIYLLRFL